MISEVSAAGGASARGAMDRLLRPRSVAIVGASPKPNSFGASILANLERAAYPGEIFLVNPKRAKIGERNCLNAVEELPEGVDCAVLAIPRSNVLVTVAACARRGVGAAIIFSAGFAEAGEEGRAEQTKILEIARSTGMLIEGPNCLGIVNYVDGTPLTFVTTQVLKHRGTDGVAIVSQSGAMAAVLDVSLHAHRLGVSYWVSTGNEAAIGAEDFVEYLTDDKYTRIIALIVEQIRKPKRFLELMERVHAAGKYVVLLHPGSSGAARASAATHTGAMAGDYNVMRTKVEHAGVVVVETLEELIDVSHILLRCPSLPAGGAAVFTESGAFKALTLDFCEKQRLELPTLCDATANALRAVLPDFIPPTNPLDITAQGLVDPDLYRRTLPIVLADDRYGSVVLAIILTDKGTSGLKLPPILEAIGEIKPTKPVIFAGLDEGAQIDSDYTEQLRALGVPFFPSPERAFRALARVTNFAARQKRVPFKATGTSAGVALEAGVIPEYKSKLVLQAAGVRIPSGELARSATEAQAIATRIGYPVVLKAQARELTHKSDVGGVALDLKDAVGVAEAWHTMQSSIAAALPDLVLDGILVESMGQRGVELIVGAQNDAEWGPVLLIGFGGVLAEALHDVRLLAPELSQASIEAEIYLLKSAALLRGFRGSPALDVRAAAEIVHRLGLLVLANPSIREVDINPVIVYPVGNGAVALDALIVTIPSDRP